jgi:antitoxin HicB
MTSATVPQQARQLAAQPYTFTLTQGEDSVWTSSVLEMPGVISEGDDPNEAIKMAQDALALMIEIRLEDDLEVPEPLRTREFSGRMQLRLNPELHRRAVMRASEENVSLNRWLAASIARSIGVTAASVAEPQPRPPSRPSPRSPRTTTPATERPR